MQKGQLIALLTLMGCLSSLSIDIFLPIMPSLGEAFGAGAAHVQLGLISFVFGFAAGHLVFGPISDSYGRRRPLIGGVILYLAGALICLFATSLNLLIVARLLQGLGACCGAISFVAIIRDLYEGAELARVLAQIGVFSGMAPVLAPSLGAFLAGALGWRFVFLFLALFAFCLLIWILRTLPETGSPTRELSFRRVLNFYGGLLKHPDFRAYSLINSLTFCGIFLFLSSSASLLMETVGVSRGLYGLLISANAVAYMTGCQLAAKILPKAGIANTVRVGTMVSLSGGVMMMLMAPQLSIMHLMVPMFLAAIGVGIAMPAATGGAMEPFAREGGRASALHGFLRFGFASLAGLVLGGLSTSSAWTLAVTIIVGNLSCLFLVPSPKTVVNRLIEAR